MDERKDIFDRIVMLPIFRRAAPFYFAHKEIILYLFFGGLTFLISVLSFAALHIMCRMNELIANVISWIFAVLFAFLTNRIWVFHSPTDTTGEFIRQMTAFFGGRVATLILEEAILYLFISKLCFSSIIVKIAAQMIVILANYVISKVFVFKGDRNDGEK